MNVKNLFLYLNISKNNYFGQITNQHHCCTYLQLKIPFLLRSLFESNKLKYICFVYIFLQSEYLTISVKVYIYSIEILILSSRCHIGQERSASISFLCDQREHTRNGVRSGRVRC